MITGGDGGDGGVEHGDLLIRFADAVVGGDETEIAPVRQEIAAALGGAALTDTAAVAALFNAIDRVADSTGIRMEDEKMEITNDFRGDLGIDSFYAADQKGQEAAD